MRITFVNQSLLMTGGFRVVCEYATRLRARGHTIHLLAPGPVATVLREGATGIKRVVYEYVSGSVADGLESYGLTSNVIRFDPSRPGKVPAADIVVATAWLTAEWVNAMPRDAGRKCYLILGYEAWSETIQDRVVRTWKLPMRRIVVARYLERLARERFDVEATYVPNGVDCDRFRPGATRGSTPTVGMLYEIQPWKGVIDGLSALWHIHEKRPDVRFVVFGRSRLRHRLPPGTRFFRNPSERDLPSVYRACNLFMNSSHSEGFSLVILEALASGCAVVATAVGELPEMGRPGEDYIMVPPREPLRLAEEVLSLLSDPERLRGMADAGSRLAQRFSWDRSADRFERVLEGGAP
ncbi:MAG TPA: glycosyltransferase family 4 protein [Candidatus Limnocylindria bacterium]|nr:glycosyltransferase family 4 protein [Candidatus Limnocylindria bacterium]